MQNNSQMIQDTPQSAHMNSLFSVARIFIAVAILAVGIYVALSPQVVYAPAPKIVLYCLISFLPAILFGAEAAAKFELKLQGFVFSVFGAAAVALGTLILLTYLSKPEQQIAVFHIFDEDGQPVSNLDRHGAVEVPLSNSGLSVTKFIDGNTLVLIFPEQVGECVIRVRPLPIGKTYVGKVAYAGNRESSLAFGNQLKPH